MRNPFHSRRTSRSGFASAVVAVALLAGCATGPRVVNTQVTTFDDWAALPAERTYVFARTLEYQHSLEMARYEDIVRDELALKGFKAASDPSRAQLAVTLRPSVFGVQVRGRDPFWSDPFYRPYGWGGYGWGGYGGFGYGRPFGWYDPWWGGYGGGGYDVAEVYRRQLEIDIDSKATPGKRYYEGRVENTGGSNALPPVMPTLIRALFADFPGNSGQTRRVAVPMEAASR